MTCANRGRGEPVLAPLNQAGLMRFVGRRTWATPEESEEVGLV